MLFSFYYTEKISNLVLNKNTLMQTISSKAFEYNILSVNAVIEGDYITPGINGLVVNKRESFYRMQSREIFNEYYLVYDQISPKISLEQNKDKIINKGNSKYKKVSIIFEEESIISNYFKVNNIKADLLVDIDTYKSNSYFEVINNESTNFKALLKNLNLNKENTKICVINENNKDICLKNKHYLVEPTWKLTSTNIFLIKKQIDNGNIILIGKSAKLEDVKIILKEISYKNLAIVYLSELISEENTSK